MSNGYGLGAARLQVDISREEAAEDKRIREYLEKINSKSYQDSVWGLVGGALGAAVLGPLGGFLGKTLFSNVSRHQRGGFEAPPDMSVGKFYRNKRLDQLSDLKRQNEMFGASHLLGIGADALNAFNLAGCIQGIGKEGLGTLTTYGTGPTSRAGFFGTTKQAGGGGIKWGGWKGMQLDPSQYTTTDPSLVDPNATPIPGVTALPVDPNQPLTAGQVYQRPRFNKIFGGQAGQTPSFWGYQTGRLGAGSPYQGLTPVQQQQNQMQNFWNIINRTR